MWKSMVSPLKHVGKVWYHPTSRDLKFDHRTKIKKIPINIMSEHNYLETKQNEDLVRNKGLEENLNQIDDMFKKGSYFNAVQKARILLDKLLRKKYFDQIFENVSKKIGLSVHHHPMSDYVS
jgi:hypothetical protein